MKSLVVLLGVFLVGLGSSGIVAPASLARFVRLWRSPQGLWIAALLRVGFAAVLWRVAAESKAPIILEILAVVMLLAGLLLPLMGVERFIAVLDWWLLRPLLWQRIWLVFAAGLGSFLLWAVLA